MKLWKENQYLKNTKEWLLYIYLDLVMKTQILIHPSKIFITEKR